jgi:hypothetical protein
LKKAHYISSQDIAHYLSFLSPLEGESQSEGEYLEKVPPQFPPFGKGSPQLSPLEKGGLRGILILFPLILSLSKDS